MPRPRLTDWRPIVKTHPARLLSRMGVAVGRLQRRRLGPTWCLLASSASGDDRGSSTLGTEPQGASAPGFDADLRHAIVIEGETVLECTVLVVRLLVGPSRIRQHLAVRTHAEV